MFGTVEIIDEDGNKFTGEISKVSEPYVDGEYLKNSDINYITEVGILMYDSIHIVVDACIENVSSIKIIEFRDLHTYGIEDEYAIDKSDLIIQSKIELDGDKVKLVCL